MAETRTCRRCGVELPGEWDAERPCPRCLLEMGLGGDPAADPGGEPDAATPPLPAGEGEEPPELFLTRDGGRARPAALPDAIQPFFPLLEVIEVVGQGGMGAVYKARQKGLDRIVALKLLDSELSRDPSFCERFSREAKALASLAHPNIVTVHDSGKAGDYLFLLLEFVDGTNLRELMRAGVEPSHALAMVSKICDALQFAHDRGVVHRDIKPENVLVDRSGEVKLVDFGLVKLLRPGQRASLTLTHQAMGTPHYMAPEQFERPAAVDHRADIYSLGVVFYELLTGELPIGRFSAPSRKVRVDVRLDEVVLKALEKEPEQRYQKASELKTDVTTCSTPPPQPPVAAAPPEPAPTTRLPAEPPYRARAAAGEAPRGSYGTVTVILLVLLGLAVAGCCLGSLGFLTLRAGQAADRVEVEASPAPSPDARE